MSKKVFIIPGHSGIDGGAARYIVDKEYTLKTALALAEYLSEYSEPLDTIINEVIPSS